MMKLNYLLLIYLISVSAHAETKHITWIATNSQTLSQTIAKPEDIAQHELSQRVRSQTYQSTDPDWNDSSAMVFDQSDSIAGSGNHRGYVIWTHKNGDKTYHKFQGTHRMTNAKENVSEGTGEFVGGTGKFKHIKGTIKYRGKFSATEGVTETEADIEY